MALDQQFSDNDILRTTESPSDENILAGLEALLEMYSVFTDTREKVADQGRGIVNAEEFFFKEERAVQIGSFVIKMKSLSQLENNIRNYKKKLGLSPEPKVFIGMVKSLSDLPDGPIAI